MGTHRGAPPINEVASFLLQYDPQAADQLRAQGPQFNELLQFGVAAGVDDRPAVSAEMIARCEILKVALTSAHERSTQRSRFLQAKLVLVRQRRFQALVATSAGSAIASVSAIVGGDLVTVIASLLALVASILNGMVETLVLGRKGDEAEVANLVKSLESTGLFAEVTVRYLAAVKEGNYPEAETAALIKEANHQFAQLVETLATAAAYFPASAEQAPVAQPAVSLG
ncbi:hypothetical protein E7V67_027120 [[Empedobacter] haloabium]|uniref:DUF4231 domain-containing protein n=1 Tax=[Empedobacter] haloabium TaxID=592317 RepID=A0ABZ1ULB0_9BURK